MRSGVEPPWLHHPSQSKQGLPQVYIPRKATCRQLQRLTPFWSGLPLPSQTGGFERRLRAFLAHPVLLSGLLPGLAQPRPGPPLCAGGNARILLFVGQQVVVCLRSGCQVRPPGQLFGGLGIKRLEPSPPPLMAVPHVPHPVSTTAALDCGIRHSPAGPHKAHRLHQPPGMTPGASALFLRLAL